MNNRLKEILRFILTGGVCTLIEYAALYLLKEWMHWRVSLIHVIFREFILFRNIIWQ